MTKTAIIVPARLASVRFPRKLLHEIRGKPLIIWVAERLASQVPNLPVYFAVDNEELLWALTSRGFRAQLTDPKHASGTDRLAEANASIGADFVINVQADEPLVTGEQIELLAGLIAQGRPMATLATRFTRPEDFLNPNQVKVVVSRNAEALYFSRAPVPYVRDAAGRPAPDFLRQHPVYRHLGLYAYRAEFLLEFSKLPRGRLEEIERLEQLRALENGHAIAVGITETDSIGVDSPEDVAAFERYLDLQAVP